MKKNCFFTSKRTCYFSLNYRLIFLIFSEISLFIAAQTPSYGQGWQWAHSVGDTSFGGSFSEEAMSAATSGRYVYITGQYQSPFLKFGSTTLTNTGPGEKEIFLTKYDDGGNVIWARKGSGISSDLSDCVATDADGNVYISGTFGSPLITFGTISLSNAGDYNLFLIKYDSSGNVLWARKAGGTGFDEATSVTTDAWGNVYITGLFTSPTLTFGTTTLTNAGHTDIFIAKYDSAGNLLWAKSADGDSYEHGFSISTDLSGGVYISGFFSSSTLTFGSHTITNTTGSIGNTFLVKYDTSGNALWARCTGGTAGSSGYSVSAHSSGCVYIAGNFSSPVLTLDTITLTNASTHNDIFLAKYDTAGNVLWARSAGDTLDEVAYSVTTDTVGNIFITGRYGSPAITFGTTTLTNAGSNNIFLTKYTPAGMVTWARSVGGTVSDQARCVATDIPGNVYITGSFGSPVLNFDSVTITNPVVDWPYIFVAKYGKDSSSHAEPIDSTLYTSLITNKNTGLLLYPNPTANELIIASSHLINQVAITNMIGQTVFYSRCNGDVMHVNVKTLVSGIYFVIVNGIDIAKFEKK